MRFAEQAAKQQVVRGDNALGMEPCALAGGGTKSVQIVQPRRGTARPMPLKALCKSVSQKKKLAIDSFVLLR